MTPEGLASFRKLQPPFGGQGAGAQNHPEGLANFRKLQPARPPKFDFVPPQGFAAQLGHAGSLGGLEPSRGQTGTLSGREPSLPGRAAPQQSLFDLGSNRAIDLSKFAGSGPLLIHFWGQSEPSRERLQDLDRIQTHHANDGVRIVGIAAAMTPGDEVRVKRQLNAVRLGYPVLLDRGGKVTLQTFQMERWKQGIALFDRAGVLQAAVKIRTSGEEARTFALAHGAIHDMVKADLIGEQNGSRDLGTGDVTIELVVVQPDGRTPAANIEARFGKPQGLPLAKTDKYGRILLERAEMNPTTGRFAAATKAGLFVVDAAKSVPVFFFQGGTEVARAELPLVSEKRLTVAVTLKSGL